MIYIRATYSYFQGTFNAKQDGPLRCTTTGSKLTFDSREEAIKYLTDHGCERLSGNKYMSSEARLEHGEYAPPVYQIRKSRSN